MLRTWCVSFDTPQLLDPILRLSSHNTKNVSYLSKYYDLYAFFYKNNTQIVFIKTTLFEIYIIKLDSTIYIKRIRFKNNYEILSAMK